MTRDANIKAEQSLDNQVREELKNWAKAGLNPDGLGIKAWLLEQRFVSLLNFMVEKEIIDSDEFAVKFKTDLLEMLKEKREILEPEVRKATILGGIELPPGVDLKDGNAGNT